MPTIKDLGLSLIESDRIYRPESLARKISNLGYSRNPGGTLSTRGHSAEYEPGATFAGFITGLGYVETLNGANQSLFARAGDTLYRHEGWNQAWVPVLTGLTYDTSSLFPDVFCSVNSRLVWCNGIDVPRLIDCSRSYGDLITNAGFNSIPSAPTVQGVTAGATQVYTAQNYSGYVHVGRIGTVQNNGGEDGALLAGSWVYAIQHEDSFGNLSPLSTLSAPATVQLQSTGYLTTFNSNYERLNHLDSMTRSFFVQALDPGEQHVAATRLYRSTDLRNGTGEMYMIGRWTGREPFSCPDHASDGEIEGGLQPKAVVAMQPFRVACEYQGRLVVANFMGAPQLVRFSEVSFPGNLLEDNWVVPDPTGGQVTGLASFGDSCVILTDSGVFTLRIVDNVASCQPITKGCGCVSPASVKQLNSGGLVWLAADGWYELDRGFQIKRLSDALHNTVSRFNRAKLSSSCAAIDPATGRYFCSVALGDTAIPNTLFVYDPLTEGWTESPLAGQSITAMVACPGHTQTLLLGTFKPGPGAQVRVLDTEDTIADNGLACFYESNVLSLDTEMFTPFLLRSIVIGLLDSDIETPSTLTLRVWQGPRITDPYQDFTFDGCASDVVDSWAFGNTTVGANTFRNPQVFWRKFDFQFNNLTGFRFAVYAGNGHDLQIAGFKFVVTAQQNAKASRTAGPTRS